MALENENATFRHGFVAESDEETLFDKESEEESYIVDSESEPETEISKSKKQKKRSSTKSSWPMDVTDNLVDVICSDIFLKNWFSQIKRTVRMVRHI